ncbi:flagellar hook-basal body protein [Desulfoscipio sp. XC116]|uniref:flagellar hook-basal body protein n=1 Tax=Desulfoscipio sp. XC116 TaxID=3144975 RepID=UPI00325AA052
MVYNSMGNINAQMCKLDITGNNVVNANTAGYKRQSVDFIDFLNQKVLQDDEAVRDSRGRGTVTALTDRRLDQGIINYTGRQLDLGIAGKGFFQVTREDGAVFYTRDGSFHIDNQGRIINQQGFVLIDEELPENYDDIVIDEKGNISCTDEDGNKIEIGQIEMAVFPNPTLLDAVGDNLYTAGELIEDPQLSVPGEDGAGIIRQGHLENSNVDLVMEMKNMIEAQRSIQFDGKIIQTADYLWNSANNLQK